MPPAHTPRLIQSFWPSRIWRMPANPVLPTIYLTFDDGPTPGVTDWVLDQLDSFQAKATFFVVGEQAQRHPDLLTEVCRRGHTVGTHTQHHLNGWKTDSKTYLADVHEGNGAVQSILENAIPGYQPILFRPPYGRLRSRDAKKLKAQKIVMWNVLAGDWKEELSADEVAGRVTRNAGNGSIVVFHDSLKAEPRVKEALAQVLNHFAEMGYRFEKLENFF